MRMKLKLTLHLFVFYWLLSALPGNLLADSGVYNTTAHGDKNNGVTREPNLPRGSCGQCHISSDTGAIGFKYFLWIENDNQLCFTCHSQKSNSGIYPGQLIYQNSNHNTDSQMIWQGPTPSMRLELDAAGKCLNCHNPHGYKDYFGLIPSLTISREENLCLNCHDGSPAIKNVANDFMKPYTHQAKIYTNRHSSEEDGNPDKYAYYPRDNRHAECTDCHNPHAVLGDAYSPAAPDASNRNKMVSGVRVFNGTAGTIPTYKYRTPEEETPALAEYEICFKCHSSWTQQPPGQADMAKLFNPNNPSYHPVEAAGKNFNIASGAFVNNWSAAKMVYCTDCHSSDNPNTRGPHGSQYDNILKLNYQATSYYRVMFRTELCFDCHNYDTYANDSSSDAIKGYGRWNETSGNPGKGHTYHVGTKQITCYSCHDSHGSVNNPYLITTGRNPGIMNYSETSNGGTCSNSTGCHSTEPQSYVINYAR